MENTTVSYTGVHQGIRRYLVRDPGDFDSRFATPGSQRRAAGHLFYIVWTENGKKREQRVKEKKFESAVKAARVKQRRDRWDDGFIKT